MSTFPSTVSNETYHYDSQFRNYIIQFMAVFAGLQVAVGENDFEKQSKLMDVPIRYGSVDRVVAAIKADNAGTNKPVRVPTMAAYLSGIQMNPEARKGVGVVERRTFLQAGRSFPDGLQVTEMQQPVPYMAVFTLSVMTSNTHQHYQILEQILTLFNPMIQIQTSDDMHDWKRITTVELLDVGLEEQYPAGTDSRIIQTSLTFQVPIYLAPPTLIRRNYIASIKMRIDAAMGNQSVEDLVGDVTRTFPTYTTVVDAAELDFPDA